VADADRGTAVPRTTWTRALRQSELERGDLLVMLVIATYMDGDGGGAYPSVETIASHTGYSPGAVRRSITRGRKLGWLERTRRGHRAGDGSTISSAYRATIPAPSTAHGCAVENESQARISEPQPRTSEPQPRTHARQGVPVEVDQESVRTTSQRIRSLIVTPPSWRQPTPDDIRRTVDRLERELGLGLERVLARLEADSRTVPTTVELERVARAVAKELADAVARQREADTAALLRQPRPAHGDTHAAARLAGPARAELDRHRTRRSA